MRFRLLALLLTLTISGVAHAIVAPKNGGRLPQAYYDVKAKDKTAYQPDRAWVQMTQRIRAERDRYLREHGPMLASELPNEYKVQGTKEIPVFTGEFSNRAAPYANTVLDDKLFGVNPTGSLSDFYSEVSYSALNLTGTVPNTEYFSLHGSQPCSPSNDLSKQWHLAA